MGTPIKCQKVGSGCTAASDLPIDPTPSQAEPPSDQFLDVDLQKAARSGLYHPQFMAKMVALDVDRDGHLGATDLEKIFGRSAVSGALNPPLQQQGLSTSLERRDYNAFQTVLVAMGNARNDRLLGAADGLTIDFSKDNIKALAKNLSKIFKEEFDRVPDIHQLVLNLEDILSKRSFSNWHDVVRYAIADSLLRSEPLSMAYGHAPFFGLFTHPFENNEWPHLLRRNEASARLVYSDYVQPGYVSSVEEEFKINIQLEAKEGRRMSRKEAELIRKALQFIQRRRPSDLKLLQTLQLHDHPVRGSALADPEGNRVVFYGPFAKRLIKKLADPSPMSGPYAKESLESVFHNGSQRFITQRLTHELGHLVASRDGAEAEKMSVPVVYGALIHHHPSASEWFAEDYSLYLLSDGRRVMRTTIDDTEVPNYAARLHYFRTHYPLK